MSPIHDRRFRKSQTAKYVDEATTKADYLKAGAVASAGAAIILIHEVTYTDPEASVAGVMAFALPIQVLLGIIGLWIAVTVLGGGAGTLGLAAFRLLACFAFTNATGLYLHQVACYGHLINLGILAVLIAWLFDFEGNEAAIAALIIVGLQVIALVLLLLVFGG